MTSAARQIYKLIIKAYLASLETRGLVFFSRTSVFFFGYWEELDSVASSYLAVGAQWWVLGSSSVLVPQTRASSSRGTSQRQGCRAAGPAALPYVPWLTCVFLSHLLPRKSQKLGLFVRRGCLSAECQPGTHTLLERGPWGVELSSVPGWIQNITSLRTGLKERQLTDLRWSQDIWIGTACISLGRQ